MCGKVDTKAAAAAQEEMSEEDKQKLLEKFDKESKTRSFVSPMVARAYKIFAIAVTLYHLIFSSGFYMPETPASRAIS